MFAVTVHFDILPDKMQFFLPLMHANAQASVSQEPGCRQFDVCCDPDRPHSVFLYELYDDELAFQSHLQSGHFKTFDAETAGMITSKSVSTFRQVLR